MEMEPYRDWAEEAHAGHPLTYTAVGIFSLLHYDIFKTENAVTICCHPGSSIAILGNQHSASNVIVRNFISRVFDISQDVLRLTGICGLERTDLNSSHAQDCKEEGIASGTSAVGPCIHHGKHCGCERLLTKAPHLRVPEKHRWFSKTRL